MHALTTYIHVASVLVSSVRRRWLAVFILRMMCLCWCWS
jgi:hypothetical protein